MRHMSLRLGASGLLPRPETQPPGKHGEREDAEEPPERRIAVERGVVGIGGVDVTTYGGARPVAVGDTLR